MSEPYRPPPEFYARLATDVRTVLRDLGPHSPQEQADLLDTLRWAEARRRLRLLPAPR